MRSLVISIFLIIFTTTFADARMEDGSDLAKACLSQPYIAKSNAISATLQLDALMKESNTKLYCAPSDLTGEQKADIVCRYMKDNPNARNLSMNVAVGSAMAKAFPCPN